MATDYYNDSVSLLASSSSAALVFLPALHVGGLGTRDTCLPVRQSKIVVTVNHGPISRMSTEDNLLPNF